MSEKKHTISREGTMQDLNLVWRKQFAKNLQIINELGMFSVTFSSSKDPKRISNTLSSVFLEHASKKISRYQQKQGINKNQKVIQSCVPEKYSDAWW